MERLPLSATDDQLIEFADRWAALMEQENYEGAFAFTGHVPEMKWSPSLVRDVIKAYDRRDPAQRVTVYGEPTDITQRKEVSRWARNRRGEIAEIWYDLNIDGLASDLTATFVVVETDAGLEIKLNEIHVM
ncbi:hypothetical protein SAMN05216570_0123 [Dyella sp. OK004]|uniref:DUF7668 domain-containing protein n=1 Tax=Dyella sp. OK004 TaxID=1855292 RepID=UPI0008E994FF|nr:hypothetical protein [Dyella sp. OK004]SFR86633.1 hypothetical protein SAMN05216570_0123 [Dyella sp. OK004]